MKRTVLALLALGLVQCIAYWWALTTPQGVSLGCNDQSCYAQAARRIVEGHPFSYAPGQPATTGQTSVLYPFVLAVPMALGADGESIRTASLALACVFYFVFLVGWGIVIAKLFADDRLARVAAVTFVGLSGVCAYVCFTQCDQGLWMALSAGIAAAIATRRKTAALALLCVAPWVRPEGMMLVFSALVVGGLRRFATRARVASGSDLPGFGLLLIPLLSGLGVFALNFALTGQAQFSSVAEKGYFKHYPLFPAAVATLKDAFEIVSSYLFSFPQPLSRLFSLPSPVASLCFWIGLVVLLPRFRQWKPSVVIFFLAASMGVGATATGGFAGLDFDRYLAWAMPVPLLTAAFGLSWLTVRIRPSLWRKMPIVAAVMLTLLTTVAMVLMMRRVAVMRIGHIRELRNEAHSLPSDARVGSEAFTWAYDLPASVHYSDIMGIFTPAFRGCGFSLASGRELLKHRRDVRFDYWVVSPLEDERDTPRNAWAVRVKYGASLVPGTGRRYIHRADWSAYDRSAESPLAPRVPVARLDVGYPPDEKAAGLVGLSGGATECCRLTEVAARASDGLPMVDGFAFVTEGQAFSLPVAPGRAAKLVVRTLGEVWYDTKDEKNQHTSYGTAVCLTVSVNGRRLGSFDVPVDPKTFTDFQMDIPGEFLTASRADFRIEGWFVAFGYWLYQ